MHRLQPILEAALGQKMVLPERKLESIEQFLQRYPEVREVMIDGTERPIARPQDPGRQKEHYSGKKRRHKEYDNIEIPHKKPRGGNLSKEQKQENREKSSRRVRCENAFAGVKRYRIVSDVYRNRVSDFDDRSMLTAMGLWNFYLMAA